MIYWMGSIELLNMNEIDNGLIINADSEIVNFKTY